MKRDVFKGPAVEKQIPRLSAPNITANKERVELLKRLRIRKLAEGSIAEIGRGKRSGA